ncbi:prolyl oligopeptidase family serine peptidase [Lolliginicoccus suaedae]|uniref:prolyl oligopeptidase family serine peptidase n=1 Tax=Lolliginicoccus suaedae TaxID=2605429 RepID=UPI0011ED5781|nr:prolyl oligopeptidase family serine peptidase [Lolliginicoccus suaedae]
MDDPYLWLEDIDGNTVLDWVRKHNDTTLAAYRGERLDTLEASIRAALDTEDRIPYARRRGEHLYNFWRDASNPRGIWRRTTLDEYRKPEPQWEILIDVDALAEAEDENWVWAGASVLRPGFDRALIALSRGGADASVIREFDLMDLRFIPTGFQLDEAKSDISWIDRDTILVGTDTGPGSLTSSGYPRIARQWRRGTPLAEAEILFEGEHTDVAVSASHDPTAGHERTVIERAIDFYRSEHHVVTPAGLHRLDVPEDAQVSLHKDWLLIRTRSPWRTASREHPEGTLLRASVTDYLDGDPRVETVFEPGPTTTLLQWSWTDTFLVVVTLRDVRTEIHVVDPTTWAWRAIDGLPELVSTQITATDADSDEIFLTSSGYITPPTLWHGIVASTTVDMVPIKQAPSLFDARGISTTQHFATSDDGTRIPYFEVRSGDGPGPTLLYGYGGFENSLVPAYSPGAGLGWLEHGGTFVVANIRGGGEYGPSWHTQALRENRELAYQDFAAVARDLVERGVTTPEQLGAQGGSNGGLLMGVMLTRYPELFGAIVCQVPLLDMQRYHLLLAGASWMAEYGNPDEPADWEFLSTYSPYHNVDPDREYPRALIMTSTRDDRVHPGHARKMTARLEESGHTVKYFENIEGGHSGAADNAQLAFKTALAYQFLHTTLGTAR